MVQNKTKTKSFTAVREEVRLPRRLSKILCLDDFENAAKKHLPKPVFAYLQSAVENRHTHNLNRSDFNNYEFIPQTLIDTGNRQLGVKLFGKQWQHSFGIAPMGLSALAAYDGDVVLAHTAHQRQIPQIMSAASITPLERIASEGKGKIFQTYLPGEMTRIEPMIERIADAGFETLVLTVDVPMSGNPENQTREGFSSPLKPSLSLGWQGLTHPNWLFQTAVKTLLNHGMPSFDNMDAHSGPPILSPNLVRAFGARDRLTWEHARYIRENWKGNFLLKGILSSGDVEISEANGIDGVIVSNHGGRQLDGAVSALTALPKCVEAAKQMPVMVDSGFRRGSDILKAYALGAAFVFVGRPFLYAAAVGGESGVNHCINLLSAEISRNMAMLGINEISKEALEGRMITRGSMLGKN